MLYQLSYTPVILKFWSSNNNISIGNVKAFGRRADRLSQPAARP
jgi:hypothetical protein